MKIRTRIATATAAAFASVFVAVPAFATEGQAADIYSAAGQPVNVVAISIVGVVLLAVVLIGSTLIGNLFEKK
ncbi:hypothetical protein JOF28_000033 [Leucobacter exalbidus]|uniref:Uncharacterized protein n=1 Tax=Leucobacter exalbidus TaxID=662960 RepID=A0A940PT80_9MICO|nr:hypothetical protein [Leucobacter exalbidus]MBP1324801.1 hypothetical protein [Leucobacter exalbidus]